MSTAFVGGRFRRGPGGMQGDAPRSFAAGERSGLAVAGGGDELAEGFAPDDDRVVQGDVDARRELVVLRTDVSLEIAEISSYER